MADDPRSLIRCSACESTRNLSTEILIMLPPRPGDYDTYGPSGSGVQVRLNQRCTRVAPNAVLSAARSVDGPSRTPAGDWPDKKVTSTLATMSWPNSM